MLDLVTYVDNMKMLLLTATPMFNDAMEIIWLLNLMNLNDKRFPLKTTMYLIPMVLLLHLNRVKT